MKILILGKQSLMNNLLSRFLKEHGFEVVGIVYDCFQALECVRLAKPDMVLINTQTLDDAAPLLFVKYDFPLPKIVILSDLEEKEEVLPILRLGVDGYISKSAPPAEVIEDLKAIYRGETRVSRKLLSTVLKAWQEEQKKKSREAAPGLTKRQLEVLKLVAEGKSNKEISQQLLISPNTVKYHISSIMAKLGAHSRTHAVFKSYAILKEKEFKDGNPYGN